MRMGFVIQRGKVRNVPPYIYRGGRKYTEVPARGIPVYFLETLSENLGTPVKIISPGESN